MSDDELTDYNKELRHTPQSHKRGINDYSISIHQSKMRIQKWLQRFNTHETNISPIEYAHILSECDHIHESLDIIRNDIISDQLPRDSYLLLSLFYRIDSQIDRLK